MNNPFKKNHIKKEDRLEMKRREEILRAFRELLYSSCENAQDLKTRAEVVDKMIDAKGEELLKAYKQTLAKDKFSVLNLKAQDGKGKEIEQKIIDFFADETLEVAQTLIQNWLMIHDAFVRKELLERKADSLDIHFKD